MKTNESTTLNKYDLKYLRDEFYYFSGQASAIIRQLAIGGIGFIWIFKKGENDIEIPIILLNPLAMLIASLASDLMQYIYGAVIWGVLLTIQENKGLTDKTKITISRKYNGPTWFFFILKIILMVIAYTQMLTFITQKIFK